MTSRFKLSVGDMMLNALYELGKTYIEKEPFNKIDLLLDDLNKVTTVIMVEFEKIGNNMNYFGVKEKEFSTSDTHLYLYKKGSSRGTDLTPTTKITEPKKTFDLKFFKYFKDNKDSNKLVKEIHDEIEENNERILADIKNTFSNIQSKKNSPLLTISIKENNETKYLNDYEFFKKEIIEKATKKYYTKKTNPTKKGEGECFLCGENKEVMGLVPNSIGFTFSTVDKQGNLPDLKYDNQWKLVPICLDCALELEAGNKFIENYLSFSEFGLRYYAIPNFLFKKDDVINSLFKYYLNHKDEKSYYNVIAKDEDEILEEAEALDNLIEFKFLFYEKSNSAFNILSYVESVIPSWIGNLYRNQKAINQNPLFKEDLVKVIFSKKEDFAGDFKEIVNEGRKYNHINNSNWVFGFLRDFYASDKSNKYYIDLISSIFSGKKVNFDFILSSAMNKIRTNFRQDREYSVKIFTLEFLMLFKFLKKVSLLIDHGEKMENETFVESFGDENQFLKYLNELDNPAKKASFLLGILTRKLIAVQYKELGSTPFTNKLWGLSVDEKKIKKLYPMVINKLNEYKITYSELTQDISINLLQTNDNWNLSRDETSFYFVLGYTLNKLYKRPKKGE